MRKDVKMQNERDNKQFNDQIFNTENKVLNVTQCNKAKLIFGIFILVFVIAKYENTNKLKFLFHIQLLRKILLGTLKVFYLKIYLIEAFLCTYIKYIFSKIRLEKRIKYSDG